jgi:predicted transcriptional regulator of viral defense system
MTIMKTILKDIYTSSQTVFTLREIAMMMPEKSRNSVRAMMAYAVKTGKLIRLRSGVYVKDAAYDRNELATRLYTPAYVSFETILAREGVVFQYYESIFVASYLSRQVKMGDQLVIFRKMKNEILINKEGLIDRGQYFEATRERAFLDLLYLFPEAHFDNLRSIDWAGCKKLFPLYQNKRLEKSITSYQKEYAQQK